MLTLIINFHYKMIEKCDFKFCIIYYTINGFNRRNYDKTNKKFKKKLK